MAEGPSLIETDVVGRHANAEAEASEDAMRGSAFTPQFPLTPPREPLANRLRLIIWAQHQPLIAALLLSCLLGMSGYFLHRASRSGGMIEIDRVPALPVAFKVDINQADFGEIITLPGVGEKLARAIVAHRENSGPFQTLDGIAAVPGIGEKKLAGIRPFLLPISAPK